MSLGKELKKIADAKQFSKAQDITADYFVKLKEDLNKIANDGQYTMTIDSKKYPHIYNNKIVCDLLVQLFKDEDIELGYENDYNNSYYYLKF